MKVDYEKELEIIRSDNGGLLRPADVVLAASPKGHPLHNSFEWSDSKAANSYREEQARHLIRYVLTIVHEDVIPIRKYASLTTMRGSDGGYVPVAECIENDELRQQLLTDALNEMQTFEVKYGLLGELVGLFTETNRVRRTRGKAKAQAVATV